MPEPSVRIMLFQGSPRRADNCPNQAGKTMQLAEYIQQHAPAGVTVEICDLSVGAEATIQPCKGCVSTAGGFHCHWPCDCYSKHSEKKPDLMHDQDVYTRLQNSDGFMVLTPIHWYGPSTVVKALFDRLVCCNLTLTVEQSRALGLGKDAQKTRAMEKSGEHSELLKNHLQGKTAAFFAHGDNGGMDYREQSPRAQQNYPPSLRAHMATPSDPEGPANSPREALMPLVWQCRYSGIDAPDELVMGEHLNAGLNHAEAMDAMSVRQDFFKRGLSLLEKLTANIVARRQSTRGTMH